MQANDGRVTFRQLMEAWQDDFNAANPVMQIRYDNFTGFYQCIKVFRKDDGREAVCAAHLHEEPHPGVEITEIENPVFIPAEDPNLFPALIARIEKRYRDLLWDKKSSENITCD